MRAPILLNSVPGTLALARAHGVNDVFEFDATPDPTTQLSKYRLIITRP